MWAGLLIDRYNALEVFASIFLALMPGTRLAEIMITIFEKKTGIKVPSGANNE